MAIETLEFGYTVIMLIYYAGLYRKKNLEIDSKVMILYYYAGLY